MSKDDAKLIKMAQDIAALETAIEALELEEEENIYAGRLISNMYDLRRRIIDGSAYGKE